LMAKVYNKEFRAWRRNQFFDRLRRHHRSNRAQRASVTEQPPLHYRAASSKA
jgi:hypothetical protein